jgi:hypothetical protein
MAETALPLYGTKMYSMLDRDNQTVLAVYPPTVDINKIIMEANGRTIIKMTVENSPAYLKGKYIEGKFYPPVEETENLNHG